MDEPVCDCVWKSCVECGKTIAVRSSASPICDDCLVDKAPIGEVLDHTFMRSEIERLQAENEWLRGENEKLLIHLFVDDSVRRVSE